MEERRSEETEHNFRAKLCSKAERGQIFSRERGTQRDFLSILSSPDFEVTMKNTFHASGKNER